MIHEYSDYFVQVLHKFHQTIMSISSGLLRFPPLTETEPWTHVDDSQAVFEHQPLISQAQERVVLTVLVEEIPWTDFKAKVWSIRRILDPRRWWENFSKKIELNDYGCWNLYCPLNFISFHKHKLTIHCYHCQDKCQNTALTKTSNEKNLLYCKSMCWENFERRK